jgi:type IV pilus assembly protein PilV
MINQSQCSNKQSGSVLIEAMVSVVIFSFGLLALISMQSAAVRSTTDAKYRSDASFLANQIIGQMWGVDSGALAGFSNVDGAADAANCEDNAEIAGSASSWQDAVKNMLPGADKERQKVLVEADGRVTVRVCWLDRTTGGYHNHLVTAQINKNL